MEELTLEQVDNLDDVFVVFMRSVEDKSPLDRARDYMARSGGQIYTQVEGENGRPVYLKGIHAVNRTGVYAVRMPEEAVRQSDSQTPS